MNTKLTTNFSIEEFDCKDGTSVLDQFIKNVTELAENLEILRAELKVPIHINSGYRSPSYNKKVGGEPNSMHLKAMASDITTRDYSPDQVANTIERLIKDGVMKQGGLGRYNGFTHYDVRGTKARWDKRG